MCVAVCDSPSSALPAGQAGGRRRWSCRSCRHPHLPACGGSICRSHHTAIPIAPGLAHQAAYLPKSVRSSHPAPQFGCGCLCPLLDRQHRNGLPLRTIKCGKAGMVDQIGPLRIGLFPLNHPPKTGASLSISATGPVSPTKRGWKLARKAFRASGVSRAGSA